MLQVPPSKEMQLYVRDHDYHWYFLTFIVESHLFCVPKYRFVEDSDVFCERYQITDGDDEHDVQSRIPLDVGLVDFRNFLKAFYPRQRTGTLELSDAEWISVLKLSTEWFFNDLRMEAIIQLTDADIGIIER
ncbi:hypothetical protein CC1G_07562 [Coprinopsis cinerea okayama7|uniref:BTB domain-containing protein n=1 Tax=Coprinopsis cinerea (strain Okayama-7 / 130 / ATCC MYA-4618 / FGSC 9003) TaxID=240176 RepID=A8NUL3_COPC7|nr:hypothetical protein CC1G_07562 [Coprinopsis cinerea okayama7\|eukprot:XP_001836479.1 hypothetical protein CC1G_07562 [Coprinopsis cinerea okayama7\